MNKNTSKTFFNSKSFSSDFDNWNSDHYEENKSESSAWRHPFVWLTLLGGVILFGGFILHDSWTMRVNSIRAEDVSESAKKNVEQQKRHCLASSKNLKQGDSIMVMPFADQAEVTDEHKVESLLNFGNCNNIGKTSVGKQPGTSLHNVFNLILTRIKASRIKGDKNPFAITISLEDAEPGPGQPNLDKNGLLKLRSLAQSIIDENSSIVIIGPHDQLQKSLYQNLDDIKGLKTCPEVNTSKCVDWAFEQARSLGLSGSKK
jgi:hypothetical protein